MTILPPEADAAVEAKRLREELNALRMRPQLVAPLQYMALPYASEEGPDEFWYADVVSGSFGAPGGTPWYAAVPRISKLAIYVEVPYKSVASGTGEVRIGLSGSSSNVSPTQSISAGAVGTLTFLWLHGAGLWGTHTNINIDARRTSTGLNYVSIGYPSIFLVDPAGAT